MATYTLEGNTIVLHRELTTLDRFVQDFLSIFTKYGDYLIVSGFVSICTGRPRGTEDVDILVPALKKEIFAQFFVDLLANEFWCYQGDTAEAVYSYIEDGLHLRLARVKEVFPNIEFIPITPQKILQYFEFTHPQKMKVQNFEFKIPPLEFEILYKEKVLGSAKDFADAQHLRTMFKSILSTEKFKEYGVLFGHYG